MSFFLSPYYLPALLALALGQAVLPRLWRPWALLGASLFAYGYVVSAEGFGWLLTAAIVTICGARILQRYPYSWMRWGAPLALVSPLILAKVDAFFPTDAAVSGFILVPGMSFYLLQAMAYVTDVRRGQAQPQSARNVLLSLSFFPSVLAGPILRTQEISDAFRSMQTPENTVTDAAIRRIAWGYFKKIVIADRIAATLQIAWATPAHVGGLGTVATAVLSYIQIYADYSGYIDIAIGSALLLGIRLPENFRTPYLASSLQDFWRRWNITLSSWLRDYVYIPLGGSKKGCVRLGLNILITFLVSGAWHGGGPRFLLWGLLHGVWMICERIVKQRWGTQDSAWKKMTGWLMTNAFLSATFVLFLAETSASAWTILSGIARPDQSRITTAVFTTLNGKIILGGIALLFMSEWRAGKNKDGKRNPWLVWGEIIFITLLISYVGMFTYRPFVYTSF